MDTTVFTNRKVSFPPTRDIVKVACELGCPSFRRLDHKRTFAAISFQRRLSFIFSVSLENKQLKKEKL